MKRVFRSVSAGWLRMAGLVLGLLPWGLSAAPADPSRMPEPASEALGYPSRSPDLDALPGFRNPPPGYGEVPFWWWTGDPLDRDRLRWQIEELHRKGISGVQVNYAHEDTPGWPTYASEPPIFSDPWWEFWGFVAEECGRRNMGIGLSGYTLDWPNGKSLISRTVYSDPEITGRELAVTARAKVAAGGSVALELPDGVIRVQAYPLRGGVLDPEGRPLTLPREGRTLEWRPTEGEWEVWVFNQVPKPGALNPLHPMSGRRVIEKFFQRFQDHAPGRSSKGLNYFFHDELQFGVGDRVWTDDFAEEFEARKGYDVFEALPALFSDPGVRTVKGRLDYLDVRMQLIEERYFQPIFAWHASRGLIYGCDQGSRGLDPTEFGDYFRAVRWYTAPGHDTPGGNADLIKGKVSSSIAHLYRRPRVWLEGYHSLGWGAAPERLMKATCENYLYGCTLLNLHGLYYSTHGSFWEWAPPCYHFRMPYWEHMGVFLKYFERLSYLLSQGVHQCDLAILYPVTPGQAGLEGGKATQLAFEAGRRLFNQGRDFIFIDDDSVARARIEEGHLHVADASYSTLILPSMRAIRWSTLQQAQRLRRAGGSVVALGALPEASDRAGGDDPELNATVRDLFGLSAAERRADSGPGLERHESGGFGIALPDGEPGWAALSRLVGLLPADVSGDPAVRALHRRVGSRDVYFVMGGTKGREMSFRSRGRVELWDAWTGETRPLPATEVEGATRLRLPMGAPEAQVIVFSPGRPELAVAATDLDEVWEVGKRQGRIIVVGGSNRSGPRSATVVERGRRIELRGEAVPLRWLDLQGEWDFELKPTMDNRWGDFRLPVSEPMIGAEARRLRYLDGETPDSKWTAASVADVDWPVVTCGFGPQFWKLGPLPARADVSALEAELAAMKQVDPARPVLLGDRTYRWLAYGLSWRWGKEGDPGHQGWHGLKENVTDDFLCLGKPTEGHNETVYREETEGTRYYLWTSAAMDRAGEVRIHRGGLAPTSIHLNGQRVSSEAMAWTLNAGSNPVLLRYDTPGRGHWLLQRLEAADSDATPPARTPLSMRWLDLPGRVPLDVRAGESRPTGWYRFTAPPGLRGFSMSVHGTVEAWVDGVGVEVVPGLPARSHEGARGFRVKLPTARVRVSQVALRVVQERGRYGGAAFPEPITLDCGPGRSPLGDWSRETALEAYSGGAWYRRDLILDEEQTQGRARLHLGEVHATAEVWVNGVSAGVRVAPPWVVDVTGRFRQGTNHLAILVYNTLANHYLTVPTRYRGSPASGLIGPVRLEMQPETVLTEPER